jgi:hypothetical protein
MPRLWTLLGVLPMLLSSLLSSHSANAFEVKKAENGASVRWAATTVTFVIDPSIEKAVPGGSAAVAKALMSWSGVSGGPDIVVTNGPGGGKAALDGQNTVLFAPHGYGPAGPALAVTQVNYDPQTGEILDADIVVSGGAHAFAVLPEGAETPGAVPVLVEGASYGEGGGGAWEHTPFDLQHVLTHEGGHALGLGDVSVPGEVMYAYSTPGSTAYRAPVADDLAGVSALYAGSPSAQKAGCGGASVAASRAGDGGGWAAATLVAAGLAWGASRRRRTARLALKAGPRRPY